MSQLTGKIVRAEIKQLEIVSDDGKRVITIEPRSDGSTKLVERDANDTPYGWQNRTEYTLEDEQKTVVTLAILHNDASYDRPALDKITSTRFQIPQPEPEKVEEENCSPIAVADAQAASALAVKEARIEAVKFEMALDHSRDRHASGDVNGCPKCDAKVYPSAYPEGYVYPSQPSTWDDIVDRSKDIEAEDDQADKIDLPF